MTEPQAREILREWLDAKPFLKGNYIDDSRSS